MPHKMQRLLRGRIDIMEARYEDVVGHALMLVALADGTSILPHDQQVTCHIIWRCSLSYIFLKNLITAAHGPRSVS